MKPLAATKAKREFALLFSVTLVTASGNTAMLSVLPGLGRSLQWPDWLIVTTFSFSSLVWAIFSPIWARRSDHSGRRPMILMGLVGFILTNGLCGLALTAGLMGLIDPLLAFVLVMLGRLFYGCLGSAAPPAVQAMVAARTSRRRRTTAMSLLASAFGLGTILGPALTPFFVIPPVGLAGPAYVSVVVGIGMLLLAYWRIPEDDTPLTHVRPTANAELDDLGMMPSVGPTAEESPARLSFTDPRIRPWVVVGIVTGHAQAVVGQVVAFLVIDRLVLSPIAAQPLIGLVLMSGAGAALLAQWGLIPRLRLEPRTMVIWGSLAATIGSAAVAFAPDAHAIGVGFAIASLGFGLIRPGFTAGASLSVEPREQGAVAGCVSSINGATFVLGPSIGIAFYHLSAPLPYLVSAASMALLAIYCRRTIKA